jgi:hypothetical protein
MHADANSDISNDAFLLTEFSIFKQHVNNDFTEP